MKLLVLLTFTLTFGCALINSIELSCEFQITRIGALGSIYRCRIENKGDIIIDQTDRIIQKVTGNHAGSNTNVEVRGVFFKNLNVLFFPLGLEKFFVNLEAILLISCKLKAIQREDLKPYANLKTLNLQKNEIQVIQADLFEFNPLLDRIYLDENKISYIHPNVLDNFNGKLNHLWLDNNVCPLEDAYNIKKADEIISKIQSESCFNKEKLEEFQNLFVSVIKKHDHPLIEDNFTEKISQLEKKFEEQNLKLQTNEEEVSVKIKQEFLKVEQELTKKFEEQNLKLLTVEEDVSVKIKQEVLKVEQELTKKFEEREQILREEFKNEQAKTQKLISDMSVSLKELSSQNLDKFMTECKQELKNMTENHQKLVQDHKNLSKELQSIKDQNNSKPNEVVDSNIEIKLQNVTEKLNHQMSTFKEFSTDLKTEVKADLKGSEKYLEKLIENLSAKVKTDNDELKRENKKKIAEIQEKIEAESKNFEDFELRIQKLQENVTDTIEEFKNNAETCGNMPQYEDSDNSNNCEKKLSETSSVIEKIKNEIMNETRNETRNLATQTEVKEVVNELRYGISEMQVSMKDLMNRGDHKVKTELMKEIKDNQSKIEENKKKLLNLEEKFELYENNTLIAENLV